jgi:hypothetical protein
MRPAGVRTFRGHLMSSRASAPQPSHIALPELLAELQRREVAVTERQLRRLRAEGLLECVAQRHEAGRRGSVSLYAEAAPDQVDLVMRIGKRERRFDERRVFVALEGGWVEPGCLRDSLIALTAPIEAEVRKLVDGVVDGDELVEQAVRAMLAEPTQGEFSKVIRHRLGASPKARAERETVAWVLASVVFGQDPGWHDDDPNSEEVPRVDVFDRAAGLDRARTDTVEGAGPLLAAGISTEALVAEVAATGAFDVTRVTDVFRAATDVQLRDAFARAKWMIDLAGQVRIASENDFAGLGSLAPLDPERVSAVGVALVVRMMLLDGAPAG